MRHARSPGLRRLVSATTLAGILVGALGVSIALAADPSPSPLASPSASPSATPSIAPSPSPVRPTPTRQPSPTSRPVLTPALSASPAVVLTGTVATLQVTGFTYLGVKSVHTGAGSIQSVEFSMTSATFVGLQLLLPCSHHVRLALLGLGAPLEARSGALVLMVTSFQATLNGAAVSYTAASPPLAQPLPGGSGTFTALTFSDVATTADRLVMHGVAFRAVAC